MTRCKSKLQYQSGVPIVTKCHFIIVPCYLKNMLANAHCTGISPVWLILFLKWFCYTLDMLQNRPGNAVKTLTHFIHGATGSPNPTWVPNFDFQPRSLLNLVSILIHVVFLPRWQCTQYACCTQVSASKLIRPLFRNIFSSNIDTKTFKSPV